MKLTTLAAVAVIFVSVFSDASAIQSVDTEPDHATDGDIFTRALSNAFFVQNQGQWRDSEVILGMRSSGVDVAFGASSFAIQSRGSSKSGGEADGLQLTVRFPGSRVVVPKGVDERETKFNYFVGGDGRSARRDVASYGAVVYEDLYEGIDLLITGQDDGVLKYEFRCDAGAAHSQIRIRYEGHDSLAVDDDGHLLIETPIGVLRDRAPVAWQEAPHHAIAARFEITEEHEYTIVLLEAPDPTRPIVIDPDVAWMSYLGGSGSEFCLNNGVVVDRADNIFVSGTTSSFNFEGAINLWRSSRDAFIVKVSPAGGVKWMTYIGGSRRDQGTDLAIDDVSNLYLTGDTESEDFEGRTNSLHGEEPDAFAVKLDSSGHVQWMTYIGGSEWDGGYGIEVDPAGNAFVCGSTRSIDFEGRNNSHHGGLYDGTLVKIRSDGQIEFMTYLGGSDSDGCHDLALDGRGNVLLAGKTDSADFEGRINTIHQGDDAFVAKVGAITGHVVWATFLGGNHRLGESAAALAIDATGGTMVVGQTASRDFEGRINSYHGGWSDAFAAHVDVNGSLDWMTYLGGRALDVANGIVMDNMQDIVIIGHTQSFDFEGRFNSAHEGEFWQDAFALRLGPDGTARRMAYLGGTYQEFGFGVAIDSRGSAVVAGRTGSIDFEGRINSFHGGAWDAFVTKIDLGDGPWMSFAPNCENKGRFCVSWNGAEPGGVVAFMGAARNGSFHIPRGYPCAGSELGLDGFGIRFVGTKQSDEQGAGQIRGRASRTACGRYQQLLDLNVCQVSNVVRIDCE